MKSGKPHGRGLPSSIMSNTALIHIPNMSSDTLRTVLFVTGLTIWVLLLLAEVAAAIFSFDYSVPAAVHVVAVSIAGWYYKGNPKDLFEHFRKKLKK